MATNYEVRFSIIIPAYNSGKTIASSLQSVLGQTFTNYELLVIDALSADDTVAVASSFNNGKISILSEKDYGIYDAMNKGIKLAKGRWLYFLGSDDTLYNADVLAKIDQVADKNPLSKIIFGDVYTSDHTVEHYAGYGFIELLDRCICQQSIFYHRSLFDADQFSTAYKISSDWDFNLKVFIPRNQPVYIPELIANYHLGGASGSWQTGPEYLTGFADKKELIIRYKGRQKVYFYYSWYYLKRWQRKIKERLAWIFQ